MHSRSQSNMTFLDAVAIAALVAMPMVVWDAKDRATWEFEREIARHEISPQEADAQRAAFESMERINRILESGCADYFARSQLVRVNGREACE